jgi:hypothetical protein
MLNPIEVKQVLRSDSRKQLRIIAKSRNVVWASPCGRWLVSLCNKHGKFLGPLLGYQSTATFYHIDKNIQTEVVLHPDNGTEGKDPWATHQVEWLGTETGYHVRLRLGCLGTETATAFKLLTDGKVVPTTEELQVGWSTKQGEVMTRGDFRLYPDGSRLLVKSPEAASGVEIRHDALIDRCDFLLFWPWVWSHDQSGVTMLTLL